VQQTMMRSVRNVAEAVREALAGLPGDGIHRFDAIWASAWCRDFTKSYGLVREKCNGDFLEEMILSMKEAVVEHDGVKYDR
jgi:hypothetical protein